MPRLDGVLWGTDRHRLTGDLDLAWSAGAMPNKASADVGPAGADQPCEAEHLSVADLEDHVREHPASGPGRRRSERPRRLGRGVCGRRTRRVSRPTISRTTSASFVSAVGRVEMWRPSRNTVIRSEIAKTSSRRWRDEQHRDAGLLEPLDLRNRRCTSWADRAAVGSSMISTRTSCDIALAISTACCSPTVSVLAGASDRGRRRAPASISEASRRSRRQLTTRPRSRWPDEDVLGDRQVGEDQGFLVDRDDHRAAGRRRATTPRTGSPSMRISPGRRCRGRS